MLGSVTVAMEALSVLIPEQPHGNPQNLAPVKLTEAEKEKALNVALSDPRVKKILNGVKWDVLGPGPRTEGSKVVGAVMLFRLHEPKWAEGEFYNHITGQLAKAKLWVGSLHVFVKDGKVAGIWPEMGRAPEKVDAPELEEAMSIVSKYPAVKEKIDKGEVFLTGVWYTSEYPRGLAFLSIRSDGELMVAVDIAGGKIVKEMTGEVR